MPETPTASARDPANPGRRANPSLRERVGALRNIPPFLREIWATSRRLTILSLSLRVVRALLPIAVGTIADTYGLGNSFIVPLGAYAFIAIFAVAARDGRNALSPQLEIGASPIP